MSKMKDKLKKVGIMQKINEAFIKVGGGLKSDSFSILLHLQKNVLIPNLSILNR